MYKCPICGRTFKKQGNHPYTHTERGFEPWNKGLTKETDCRVTSPWNCGLTKGIDARLVKPIEVIEKQRASIMGKNKGRKFGEDFKLMRRQMMLGTHPTPTSNKKRSQSLKEKIAAGEWYPTLPSNPFPKPNQAELKLLSLLEQHFPGQYAYTGDGKVAIDHLIPDFTNCDGRKEVIELYGDYWHKNDNPQDKIARYAKFGFHCLVLWEKELKTEENVLKEIQDFRGGKRWLSLKNQHHRLAMLVGK